MGQKGNKMRKFIRDQIVEILNTFKEAVIEAEKTKEKEIKTQIIQDCIGSAEMVLNIILTNLSEAGGEGYKSSFAELNDLFQIMLSNTEKEQKTDKEHRKLRKSIEKLQRDLNKEPEVKLEVVFMPYKLSMWDSMESIWRAAKEDSGCDCYVVPVPYYDRDHQQNLAEKHDEWQDFPKEIGAIYHKNYDLEKRKPDLVYIHNPYDEFNYVTSVDPAYYSYQLKKHVSTLVYVPYCIHTVAHDRASSLIIYERLSKNVDYLICQNDIEYNVYRKNGINFKKLLPLGNPKLDGVGHMNENPPQLPEEWKEKINGKKVILFNLSIAFILKFNIEYIYWLFDQIMKQEDIVLLFRPHPLLETTFKSMRRGLYQQYIEKINQLENAPNVIIDKEKEVYPSFYYSDCMISSQSSLVNNYILTEKPIFSLSLNPLKYHIWRKKSLESTSVFDITKLYYTKLEEVPFYGKKELKSSVNEELKEFSDEEKATIKDIMIKTLEKYSWEENDITYYLPDSPLTKEFAYNEGGYKFQPVGIQEFLDMVSKGEDPGKEERMSAFCQSAEHCDGKNGKNIHQNIMKKLSNGR